MRRQLSVLRKRLRLPFWHRADIEAEIAAHLLEAAADLREQGNDDTAAQQAALARFGDLHTLADSLQSIHSGWTGGTTVQQRFGKVIVIAVIAIGLIALPLTPALRGFIGDMVALRNGMFPSQAVLERVARQHADDVFMQLALNEQHADYWSDEFSSEDFARFRQVAAQFPDSTAAQLWLAVKLLTNSGQLGRVEEYEGRSEDERQILLARRAQQQARLAEAIPPLQRAAALDRANAAPQFLLAYAYFAQGDDARGNEALRAALARPDWTLYTRERTNALLVLYQESGVSPLFIAVSTRHVLANGNFQVVWRMRSLVRFLSGEGEKERQAGCDAPALFYYRAGVHLGDLYLRGGNDFADSHNGYILLHLVIEHFISPVEMARIKQQPVAREVVNDQLAAARARHFDEYLRAHGAADLAQVYQRDLSTARGFETVMRNVQMHRTVHYVNPFESLLVNWSSLTWMQAAFILALLLLTGLVSAGMFVFKRRPAPAGGWRWWQWLLLVVFACLPSQIMISTYAIFEKVLTRVPVNPEVWLLRDYFTFASLATPLLFIVVPIVGGLRQRRRLPQETRPGRLQAVLASFWTLLPPSFAVLLITALALTIPAQRQIRDWVKQEKRLIQQGEMQYWKINLPPH